MKTKRLQHNRRGNCWTQSLVFKCLHCRPGNLCDACHAHDEPRGDCQQCPRCPACDAGKEET
jgi:hypothetical protein